MFRVFVALSLPEVVADSLTPMQFGLDGARWRGPDQFHITLQFIGSVNKHGLDDVANALDGVTGAALKLTLSGCDFFGDKRPHSVWAGVAKSEGLLLLQAKIENRLRQFGVSVENRKFIPHVTLAYLRGTSQAETATYCARHNLYSCGPFPVNAFHLYQSHLGNEASHYELLETYPLSFSR